MKVARSVGTRFTPLMMEEDEVYINDIAVEATCMVLAGSGAGSSKQYVGRLRLCSSSLVLEPESVEMPMLRIALKSVSTLAIDSSSSMISFRSSSHTILRNVGEYSPAVSVTRQDSYTLSPQFSAHQAFTAQLQKVSPSHVISLPRRFFRRLKILADLGHHPETWLLPPRKRRARRAYSERTQQVAAVRCCVAGGRPARRSCRGVQCAPRVAHGHHSFPHKHQRSSHLPAAPRQPQLCSRVQVQNQQHRSHAQPPPHARGICTRNFLRAQR